MTKTQLAVQYEAYEVSLGDLLLKLQGARIVSYEFDDEAIVAEFILEFDSREAAVQFAEDHDDDCPMVDKVKFLN